MGDMLTLLFDTSDFPARWTCGRWTPIHGWVHIISDILTFLAYTTIPVVLGWYCWRRRDVPFPGLAILFCAFIFACGTTHLLEAVIFWEPVYRVAGLAKAFTALVSVATVIALIHIMPKAMELPGITRLNKELNQEVERRRLYEIELKRGEARYRTLVEAVASAVWFADLDGAFQPVRHAWTDFTGQSAEAAAGEGWLQMVHESDRPGLRDAWQQAVASREPMHEQARLWHPATNSFHHCEWRATPVISEQGEPIEWIGTVTDVHEKRLAEELFHLALEASPSAMLMVDSEGDITLANRQAEQLTGYPREELLAMSVDNLVPDRHQHAHPRERKAYMQAPSRRMMGAGRDLNCRTSDGREIPVEIGLTPIQTEQGAFVVCSIVDVTVRKVQEQQLQQRADELARSNRDLEQYASFISHDMKEPARVITMFCDLLQRHYEQHLDDKARKWIGYLVDASQRMEAMISDLLKYSRVQGRSLEFAPFSLVEAAQAAQQNLLRQLHEADATVTIGDLPVIEGDRTLMIQVFQNLIANAVKFCGDVPPQIDLSATRTYEDIVVAVADNGIGMDPANHEKIFAIFQRLHSSDEYPGTGIGLAFVKRVVELHGGTIHVESALGEGSTFFLTFPLNRRQ